jgi:hypothetical protein
MPTLADLRTRFRGWYPEATDAVIDECINHALKQISFLFPAFFKETSVTLVADQALYPWPTDMVYLYSARYEASATSRTRLNMTSPERVENVDRDWRNRTSGTPTDIMPQGANLRLWPAPDTATDSGTGYPKVTLSYTAAFPALSSGGDQLNAAIFIEDWALKTALKRYASQRVKQDFPLRDHEEREALGDLQSFLTERGIDMTPRIIPGRRRRRQV